MRHLIGAIGLAVILACAASLIQNEFYLRTLFMICIYFLCAAGMNVLLGFAGQKSLGQAGLFAAGAYTVALLTTLYGFGPWTSLLIACFVSAIFGVLIAVPSLRVRGPSLAMVTLAFGIVIEKLVAEGSDIFGGAMGIYAIQPLTFNGVPFTMLQWVWFGLALCLVTHILLRNLLKGRFGRAFLSLQADEIAAGAVGVPVYRYKVLAFVIAAVTCGLAGALVAQQNQYINSDFINFNLSIFILLLVLFGGSGSLSGPLLGSVSLVIIGAVLARWTWAEHFVNGALLLFALFAMPKGLAGVIAKLAKRSGKSVAASETPATLNQKICLPTTQADVPGSALMTIDSLHKAFGGVVPAKDISVRLTTGHIHALIGPNGAGKSTFINMLTGIISVDRGSIKLRDRDITGHKVHDICRRGIARTFQNLRLFQDLSVRQNVLLGQHSRMKNGFFSSLLGLPLAKREEESAMKKVDDVLRFTGLTQYAEAPAGSLAYGLQRRVELARALASEPQLLLLDEPAAGLNPQETAELGQLLVRIREEGVTILLIEHHMDLVMTISDHVVVLDYGQKIAEGSPDKVQSNPRVMEAYLGAAVEAA
ncbi:branched-chain amino acid ABC transporter ATP-binding protein/permease [Rhizobium multihospitium]|uniref:Branched-chain amino acid transport system permease protein n=1 Tax=Rhizobium multihospitium TaxID=410764 RepID=A0A1C3X5H4_9HYPH|nr:branched-chain amino acid ABC transporter ATP-binding protein/permease [Rhizobium multihospitium]SCB47503.1 branched-chain amino acid transport system permease protein [Rhizobium multihospitium]